MITMFRGKNTVSFNPVKDIPSLTGKVILVTGGNAGLGKQSVLEFARHNPRQIWLASRDLRKADAAAAEIKQQVPDAAIRTVKLDLASFDSIKSAAETLLAESDRLDILMLNAGIMAAAPGLTRDGYEVQFGTNHMGHALLTKLLIPLLTKTANGSRDADVRVISLASHGHNQLPQGGFSFNTLKTSADSMGAYQRYYQSKLANVLWARQLAKEHGVITVASIHPGVVQTDLMQSATGSPTYLKVLVKIGYKLLATVEDGAQNQLWASVSKDVKSGEYYEPVGVGELASADGKNDELAREIWDWTERELEAFVRGTKSMHQ